MPHSPRAALAHPRPPFPSSRATAGTRRPLRPRRLPPIALVRGQQRLTALGCQPQRLFERANRVAGLIRFQTPLTRSTSVRSVSGGPRGAGPGGGPARTVLRSDVALPRMYVRRRAFTTRLWHTRHNKAELLAAARIEGFPFLTRTQRNTLHDLGAMQHGGHCRFSTRPARVCQHPSLLLGSAQHTQSRERRRRRTASGRRARLRQQPGVFESEPRASISAGSCPFCPMSASRRSYAADR